MHVIINSIALFYLLPFISVGVYTIGTQKHSLANFLLFIGGITALQDNRVGSYVIRVLLE